jgi:hypothetical protein
MSERIARVLAHQLRNHVLFEYQGEPASPSEVARRIGQPVNLVSYHTGVLLRHGCIELVRTGRRRGAQVSYYRATVSQFIEDASWVSLSVTRRRHLALNTLAQAADEAHQSALAGAFDAPPAHLSRTPLELDDEGVQAVSRLLRRTFDQITSIEESARQRSDDRRPHMLVMLAFAASRPRVARARTTRQPTTR